VESIRREIADLKVRNADDHRVVKENLAELKAELSERDKRFEQRDSAIDQRLSSVERTIWRWAGAVGVLVAVVMPIVAVLLQKLFG
jgi:septation ring formation regulator EzrA